jgi:hypothetical protein
MKTELITSFRSLKKRIKNTSIFYICNFVTAFENAGFKVIDGF